MASESTLMNSFVLVSIVAILTPVLAYYTLLKFTSMSEIMAIPIMALITMTFIGQSISKQASIAECDNYDNTVSFLNGLKVSFAAITVYFLSYFLTWLKQPFYNLFGTSTKLVVYLIDGFFLAMGSWPAVASAYFVSKKKGCMMNPKALAQAQEKAQSDLDKKSE
tara:strand:- start:1125 stop:1619 length:495 start_codon:yes stop_codon:yes gene_type:complete